MNLLQTRIFFSAGPSTAPNAPADFVCGPGKTHLLCACCTEPFPDRRRENNPDLPPVQCGLFLPLRSKFSSELIECFSMSGSHTVFLFRFELYILKYFAQSLLLCWLIEVSVRSFVAQVNLKLKVLFLRVSYAFRASGGYCQGLFCHMYWGCRSFWCKGCLNKFKGEMSLVLCPLKLFGNGFGENIFRRYC